MNILTAYLFSIFLLVVGVIMRPHDAACPAGFWENGIRPSGSFGCRPVPRVRPSELVAPYRPVTTLDADEDLEVHGQLYCDRARGEEPRAMSDGVHVRCVAIGGAR